MKEFDVKEAWRTKEIKVKIIPNTIVYAIHENKICRLRVRETIIRLSSVGEYSESYELAIDDENSHVLKATEKHINKTVFFSKEDLINSLR